MWQNSFDTRAYQHYVLIPAEAAEAYPAAAVACPLAAEAEACLVAAEA